MKGHRTVLLAALLVLTGFGSMAFQVGIERFLAGVVVLLDFLRDQAVTLMFLMFVACLATWILKLHFSDDGDYKNFKLQKLLINEKGEPDKKAISLWIAQLSGLYAFFYLLHHDVHAFTSFANWFLLTLMGFHGANEIFGKKDPPAAAPGVTP